MEVFTELWAEACCARINQHAGFRAAGARWEDSVVLTMTADAGRGVAADRAFLLDLFRGECRSARVATAEDLERASYVMAAAPAVWQQLLSGGLDPVAALMQGKLRLVRGGLFALAQHAGAAKSLVAAAGEVAAEFPG